MSHDRVALHKYDKENLRVVLFVSRKKDNKYVQGFKERRVSFITDEDYLDLALRDEFVNFSKKGLPEEVSRFYISVNKRDWDDVTLCLAHRLIDNLGGINLVRMDSIVASIAARPEYRAEKSFLLDLDCDKCTAKEIKDFVKSNHPDVIEEFSESYGNYYLLTKGFDTRNLMAQYDQHVELKRDAMKFVASCRNDSFGGPDLEYAEKLEV